MFKRASNNGLRKRIAVLLALTVISVSTFTGSPFGTLTVNADTTTQNHSQRIVQQYKGVWTTAPTNDNNGNTPDSPLIGNGDVGVTLVNNIDSMVNIIGKTEFWSLSEGRVKALARLSFSIPGMTGASYSMEQNLAKAELDGTYSLNGNTINTTSWVQATDTTNNMYFTKFTYTGSVDQNVGVSLAVGNGNSYNYSVGSSGDVLYMEVKGDSADTVGGYLAHKVKVATRIIGTTGSISDNTLNFTLQPGNTYTLATCIMSNYDDTNYQNLAISNISSKVVSEVDLLKASHQSWWDNFWSKSFVEIPDKTLEKSYYGSLYILASCSRTDETAPGLWGPWSSNDGAWNGDYHLNYNYEAPFYFAMPTNHTELADAYDKPILDWIPKGQAAATENGYSGVYYPVAIGPLPNGSADSINYWNQKSDTAFAATDMLMHFYSTYNATYANSIYPYLKQVAAFWQNYLVWDGNRYVIYNDAQHEGDAYPQTNGVMSLGLVRYLLKGCIEISTTLNVDSTLRVTWQNILNNLSAFPTQIRNGQTVFRYTEVGLDWNNGNSIGIQHIYPGSQIGLSSDAGTLQIAQNMIGQMQRWNDSNGTNTFYPAAARVGYSPSTILSHLTSFVAENSYNNLHIRTDGGGLENLNVVPATICEMLLQSFQDKIRVFANWPSDTNGKFGDLRANGGFLISSDMENNIVQYMRIISENGRSFSFINPWPGQTLRMYRNGSDAGTLTGSEITITTSINETIHIVPDGTSYSSILDRITQPITLGVTNVALNKTATVSDYNNDGTTQDGSKAIDGYTTTKWCSQPPSSTPGDKWLKLDLGTNYNISRWVVKHAGANGEAAYYNTKDFKLQTSGDGTNWTDVDSVTGNTVNITDRNITQVTARYVRLYITAPVQDTCPYVQIAGDRSNARIYEFEVYGASTLVVSNVALNKTATVSDYNNDGTTQDGSKAIDGYTTTKWCSQPPSSTPGDKWLKLDLGTNYDISRWVVKHAGANGEAAYYNTKDFKLQTSGDGTNWTDVDSVTGNTVNTTDRNITQVTARYVRLYITAPVQDTCPYVQIAGDRSNARIYEFEVYGY